MNTGAIRAMPFVPGRVRGALVVGPLVGAVGDLLLLQQEELDAIRGAAGGLLVVDAAPFSHPMIRALGRGLPLLMLTAAQAAELSPGACYELDGATGRLSPAASAEPLPATAPPEAAAGVPYTTRDGATVELRASIGNLLSATCARRAGATAIGSLRSEYLCPDDGSVPNEAFFRQALAAVIHQVRPLPITIRLLDLVSDKRPAWLPAIAGTEVMLGLRSGRLFAVELVQRVFRDEVSALGVLAQDYPLRILVPSGISLMEFVHWREQISSLQTGSLPIGAMLETPAALLELEQWLAAADFVAVGCNDLMQCFFGADRDVPQVRDFLDPYAPVLWRFLRQMATLAGTQLSRVQLCGLLPQVQGVLPVLLGLGYRVFSGEPVLIPSLARTVTGVTLPECATLAEQVCAARDSAQVRERLGVPPGPGWGLATEYLR